MPVTIVRGTADHGVLGVLAFSGIDSVADDVHEDPDPMRLLAGAVRTERWQQAFHEGSHRWQRGPAIIEAEAAGV